MEKTRTLEDLRREDFVENPLCVVGNPVRHSLSPFMQNAALAFLSKQNPTYKTWHYYKFEILPEDLLEALEIFKKKSFKGINFTLPHKLLVKDFADTLSSDAKLIGACNTFKLENNSWAGFNTDGFGLEMALEKSFGVELYDANIVILGAGGAARAAAFYAAIKGAKSLRIFNRSRQNLDALITDLAKNNFNASGNILESSLPADIEKDSIIINCTSVGLKDSDTAIADFSKLDKSVKIFDMAYRFGAETKSVEDAQNLGIKAASGLPMLAYQGAKSLSIWTNEDLLGEFMLDCLINTQ